MDTPYGAIGLGRLAFIARERLESWIFEGRDFYHFSRIISSHLYFTLCNWLPLIGEHGCAGRGKKDEVGRKEGRAEPEHDV